MHPINLHDKLSKFSDHWSPRIIAELNGQQVKLAKIEGEFVFHHHEHEDELFLVLKGAMRMEFKDAPSVEVREGEIIVVPKGVEHRPVTIGGECAVMLFEPASTLHTGNRADDPRTKTNLERI
jgi:mannose-6-phosphate isomerase-like protein (cupin superfamily)